MTGGDGAQDREATASGGGARPPRDVAGASALARVIEALSER
jgi:hypothetical protein